MRNRYIGKFLFRPDSTALYIFLIALAIFILGVQIGIKHGRELQLEDMRERAEAEGLALPNCNAVYCERERGKIEYGYDFSN